MTPVSFGHPQMIAIHSNIWEPLAWGPAPEGGGGGLWSSRSSSIQEMWAWGRRPRPAVSVWSPDLCALCRHTEAGEVRRRGTMLGEKRDSRTFQQRCQGTLVREKGETGGILKEGDMRHREVVGRLQRQEENWPPRTGSWN